jgi:hypothetical protein
MPINTQSLRSLYARGQWWRRRHKERREVCRKDAGEVLPQPVKTAYGWQEKFLKKGEKALTNDLTKH